MRKLLFLIIALAPCAQAQVVTDMPVASPKFVLLLNPKVQEHLKFTPDQKQKVKSILDKVVEDDGKGHRMIQITGDTDLESIDKEVSGVLDSKQGERFEQLYLQSNGYCALSQKDYAKKLDITADQVKKLDSAWDHHRERMREHISGSDPSNQEIRVDKKAYEEMRAAVNKEVEGILTSEQILKWKGLLGEKFEFKDDGLNRSTEVRDANGAVG